MKLYICQTIDGFIAKADRSFDFLDQFNEMIANSPNQLITDSYQLFMNDKVNVVEGYTTFKQLEEQGYVEHYSKYNHYVITNKHQQETSPHVTAFIDFDQLEALNLDPQQTFLVGGSQIITEALNRKLVTEIIITGLPIFLGSGIRLFDNIVVNPKLVIKDLISDDNFYQITYAVDYSRN